MPFRSRLWRAGVRYRVCVGDLPGKPDVVITSRRVVVFIDGDFWHGNQWRRRKLPSLEEQFTRTNSRDYWLTKIRRNMGRDCAVTQRLLQDGWTVLRFWESQLRSDLERCVEMTLRVVEFEPRIDHRALLPAKTVAEFFAGIGLMRMGLEEQGWTVRFANDIDPEKHEIYVGHFRDTTGDFVLGDVHELPPRRVPTVTLATASFPCNDLSLAGSRNGLSGKNSSAFWGFIGVLEGLGERKPPLVLLENVPGFLTSHRGMDFRDAMLALNRLGYSVDPFVLDAARFVPQSRQRLFVVATLDSLFASPEGADGSAPAEIRDAPSFYESDVRPKALADLVFTDTEIRWRIRDLPCPPQRTTRLEDVLEDLPDSDGAWWSAQRAEYLLNQMSERHRQQADQMIAGSEYTFGTVFRRVRSGKSMAELRTDGIAGCLRTPRGGSGRQILFRAGKGEYAARLLTARECARLMGADNYNLSAPLNQSLFGFGDAVCVPVISWIAEYYLNPLVNELIRGYPLRIKEGALTGVNGRTGGGRVHGMV